MVDDLQGSIDALAWGKIPAIGTGQFDIVYSGKVDFTLFLQAVVNKRLDVKYLFPVLGKLKFKKLHSEHKGFAERILSVKGIPGV